MLAQRQRRAGAGARRRGGGHEHGGRGGDRRGESLRDGEILSRGAQGRSQADRRSRPAGRGGGRAAAAADASDAAVSVAGRLPQSHAPREPRLPRRTGARHGAHRARLALAGRPRGPHRPLLRHRGRHRSGAHFRARARRRARARCVAGAPPRALLSRAATPRQALRGDLHRRRGGACRPARRAGGGHQRRALPRARAVRVARGARLHPRRDAPRRHRPGAPLFAPAVPAHAAGDGGPVRRPARGARQLRRDRAPLEPPAHSRGSAAAAVSAARRGEHRGIPARGSRARPRGPLRRKYGRERVSQIITYGTMAAKAVVRDVGRVLGMAYGYVDRIAKLIPFELGITLDAALEREPELKRLCQSEDEVRNLIDLARSLEGLTRNAGMHAGGVVIAPSALTDFTPLYRDAAGGAVLTQFDKDDVEAAGLVKFDFLGLRTLTIIERAVALLNRARPPEALPLAMSALPMDDAPTYALLKSCRTTAVFQLESRGMKDLIRRLQPDCFEDIVALVALFRPGPLQSGMVDDFINRKHGRSEGPIDYLHPSLEPILKPTYGVILYQEQVMQIAQVLAGYTLGGADLLRRAMGKKSPEEMAQQRSVFVSGAVARGVREQVATHIFDLMEKFAGYGFNKSHSAAYALLAYQTAYLKAHYPAAFMAAVLSADMDHTDKVVTLIKECTDLGLAVMTPDVIA